MMVPVVLLSASRMGIHQAAVVGARNRSVGPLRPMSLLALMLVPLLLTGLLACPAVGLAQTPQIAKSASSASSAASVKPQVPNPANRAVVSKPVWAELSPMQQQTLKPLAASWNTLSEAHKRKWLEISKNYPSLAPADQATMHSRMNEWVALSPQQRAEARLNFAKTKELSKQLTPDEKKAKWQTYQALSPEEKQKLAANATTRPVGAALAVKPVSPQKLAAVPPHGIKPPVNPLTLAPDSTPGAATINTGATVTH